jgi:hypothetical protein
MNEQENNKAEVKIWLYELLAKNEICSDVEGRKTETSGNKVTIELQFKI